MGFVYKLTFENGKSYIGITAGTMNRRMALHRYHAKSGRQGALQNAVRLYGIDSIRVDVILESDDWDYLCMSERRLIIEEKTKFPKGYNLTDGGEGNYGYIATPETRKKMSESAKGKHSAPRPNMQGRKRPKEVCEKISEGLKGRPVSEETREKHRQRLIGNKFNLGRVTSEETKKKISDAQKGIPRPNPNRVKKIKIPKGPPWSEARRAAYERKKNA